MNISFLLPIAYMSFRSGPSIKLIVHDLNRYTINVVYVAWANLFGLEVALQYLGISVYNDTVLFVKRNKRLFVIQSNRDVEELGGRLGEEKLYVSSKNTIDLTGILPLSKYQIVRSDIPARLEWWQTFIVSSGDILSNGKQIVHHLKKNGYFRIMLSDIEMKIINDLFSEMKQFSDLPLDKKREYSHESIGSDLTQPQFGYRETQLHKQYFVCRQIADGLRGILKYSNESFEKAALEYIRGPNGIGLIAKYVLTAILFELGLDRYQVRNIIDGTLQTAQSLGTLGFTSTVEVFKYDCTGYADGEHTFRIPCGEHSDVSLLTLIPKCLGSSGLEIFDWEYGWVNAEIGSFKNECIVFPGELLYRLTAGEFSPTSHRVVVDTSKQSDNHKYRYSAPFEILLDPLYKIDCESMFEDITISPEFKKVETSQDYISRISQKLVSVNK